MISCRCRFELFQSLFSSSWPKCSSHCTRLQSSILNNRQLQHKYLSLNPHIPKDYQIIPITLT